MSADAAAILTIFWALDEDRREQLTKEAQRLLEEQQDEDMGGAVGA